MSGYDFSSVTSIENEPGFQHIFEASGKKPALVGFDLMHATGLELVPGSENYCCEW
jgi:hypothetical protein